MDADLLQIADQLHAHIIGTAGSCVLSPEEIAEGLHLVKGSAGKTLKFTYRAVNPPLEFMLVRD